MNLRALLAALTVSALLLGTMPLGAAQDGNQTDPPNNGNGAPDDPAAGNSTAGDQDGNQTNDGDDQNATAQGDGASDGYRSFQEYCQDNQDACADCRGERFRDCLEDFCEEYPGGADCRRYQAYEEQRERFEERRQQMQNFRACLTDGQECEEAAVDCARQASDYERGNVPDDLPAAAEAGRCFALQQLVESVDKRRYIDFDADAEADAVWDYQVRDILLADGIWFDAPENATILKHTERLPHTLAVSFSDANSSWRSTMRFHDNPTGLATLKAGNGTFVIDLPDNATVTTIEEGHIYRIVLEDGSSARLTGERIHLDGDLASSDAFMALHLPPARIADDIALARPDDVDEEIQEAMERRHLGATIGVQKRGEAPPTGAEDDVEDQLDAPEVLTYDDVAVALATPTDTATSDDPLRIEVDAELDEGRTIVIDVDPALFADPENLEFHYFDVLVQGGQKHEVEVHLAQASSLKDAMDPTDDGIQPEYWVVQDDDGVHILLSVPTWSTHALTVASSIVEAIKQPSVAAGMLAGLAGSLIATYGMFRPRRPSE